MAVYKVIQNVEAEDKLVGPLTLRQFIYAMIAAGILWLGYVVVAAGAWFLVIPLLPFFAVLVFFAFPWGKDQSTEIWALARIRFLFKPRKRIWDQSGAKELVTITAPKREARVYSDGLSQQEVRGRLRALAETVDSRGWSTRYMGAVNGSYISPVFANANNSDRLIDATDYGQPMPVLGNEVYEDMFDPTASNMARQFDNMLNSSAQQRHEQLVQQMHSQTPPTQPQSQPTDYWFLNQPRAQSIPTGQQVFGSQVVQAGQPTPTTDQPTYPDPADEAALVEELRTKQAQSTINYSHLPTILPLADQEKLAQQATQPQQYAPNQAPDETVTTAPDAAILELAQNDDLNIATIARQAKKAQGEDPDEVVISLH